jgi:CHASE3 domain sensor protein
VSRLRPPRWEEKVEYLLNRDQEVQKRFDHIDERIAGFDTKLSSEVETAVQELRAFMEERLQRAADAYINLRLTGVLILIVGVVLNVTGSLL